MRRSCSRLAAAFVRLLFTRWKTAWSSRHFVTSCEVEATKMLPQNLALLLSGRVPPRSPPILAHAQQRCVLSGAFRNRSRFRGEYGEAWECGPSSSAFSHPTLPSSHVCSASRVARVLTGRLSCSRLQNALLEAVAADDSIPAVSRPNTVPVRRRRRTAVQRLARTRG